MAKIGRVFGGQWSTKGVLDNVLAHMKCRRNSSKTFLLTARKFQTVERYH